MDAVVVESVSKSYALYKNDLGLIADAFGGSRCEKKVVLSDVSFSIKKGEKVGIIGQNGSGKSTLLKIIAGLTGVDSGAVDVSGRVMPLIDLGAGFNPNLTGRENVFFKGYLLGYTTEKINSIIPKILSICELEASFDHLFKTYSSGMHSRLGFAFACVSKPDILLIDEIFAVGDEYFRKKSSDLIKGMFLKDTTVIFISHSRGLISELCSRVIYLSDGVVSFAGDVSTGYAKYGEDLARKSFVPRFFVSDIRFSNNKLCLVIDTGVGRNRKICDSLNDDVSGVVVESYVDEVMVQDFVRSGVDCVFRVVDGVLYVLFDVREIVGSVSFRFCLDSVDFGDFYFLHGFDDGLLRDVNVCLAEFLLRVKFDGRSVLFIEKYDSL